MSRTRSIGLGLLILLGLLDILGLAGFFMDDAPPVWVLVTGGALGVLTLAGAFLAYAGRRGGLAVAGGARIVAALLSIGAFTDSSAPGWSKVVVGVALALTVVGVVLVAVGRPTAARALA